jgi:hypothetical protein
MKKCLLLLLILNAINTYSQEFTVSKSYVLTNKNIWEVQKDPHALLKRVLFFSESEYGVGFVFTNNAVRYYNFNDWTVDGNTYSLENANGMTYKLEFNEKTKKIKYLYLNLEILIDDDVLGEVKKLTRFRFEF